MIGLVSFWDAVGVVAGCLLLLGWVCSEGLLRRRRRGSGEWVSSEWGRQRDGLRRAARR